MSGTLYVVATPIGNLEDITLRALRVLGEVDLIAAEDTRRTARLLAHHAISTPTLSFHEHNARMRIPELVRRLEAGQRIAVVTDAGVPGVSDPGVDLIQACVKAGVAVDPIPGPTAPITAAIASGFPLAPLTIFGFPPARANARSAWLQQVLATEGTLTFFEAPHRIVITLAELADFSGDRPICVARELTKVHQEFVRGTAREVLARLREARGEFTVVIGPSATAADQTIVLNDEEVAREFGLLTENAGFRRRDAIATIAKKIGRSTRDVYAAVERAKDASH